jgi:hypothetical protein
MLPRELILGTEYRINAKDCCLELQFIATLERILFEGDQLDAGEKVSWPAPITWWSNGLRLDGNFYAEKV